MSIPIRHIASWIVASLLACAAASSLEAPECTTGTCVAEQNHVCFENGHWVVDKKLRIGFQS